MSSTASESQVSLCTRILQEEIDDASSGLAPSLDDNGVKDAVDGLLLLNFADHIFDSSSDSDDGEEDDDEDGEEDDDDEEDEEEDDEEQEEEDEDDEEGEARPGLDGKTWNWKKPMSVYKSCKTPPPSPENEHIAELLHDRDELLHRRAVLSRELEIVRDHQNKVRAFNLKLKKKLKETEDK